MLVLAAARTVGPRWVALLFAVGTIDGLGVVLGGFAALVAAFGTLLSGLALYQRGRRDATEEKAEDAERKLAAALEREVELLRAKLGEGKADA